MSTISTLGRVSPGGHFARTDRFNMIAPIPLGTILRQRYLIQQILGQGGFGRTYLALDQERFGECCVLKEFSVPYQDDALIQKSRKLFQREANALYQIQHPQVPRFWAAFEDEQRLFLVQDFVEGQTYRQLLNDRKDQGQAFSEAEVRHFLKHMLPVLIHIHDRGIIHRDISPENLILSPSRSPAGRVTSTELEPELPVLIDFGAVKEATTHWPIVSAVTRVGKVGYAPPEQLQTGKVFPNSDLYALAASSLTLLTGKEPRSLLDSQTLEWRWQPYASLSDDLAAVLLKMLSIYPSDRYQSAHEVWTTLQPLLGEGATDPDLDLSTATTELSPPPPHEQRPGSEQSNSMPVIPAQMHPPRNPQYSVRTGARNQPNRRRQMRLRLGLAASLLIAVGLAGSVLWRTWKPQDANGDVWVSGAKLSRSEASRLLDPNRNSSNSTLKSGSGSANHSAPPKTIQFPAGEISAVLQGELTDDGTQPYLLQAAQGQILTATLQGDQVVMNLLRSNQQGIDAAAYQTQNWTGQLPATDEYTIQVVGSGAYSLDVAITPLSRPTQEKTQRVSFEPGNNRTAVTGTIAPNQLRRYLIKANQGQIMVVKVVEGGVSFSAIAPNGQRIGGSATNSKDWKGRLPQTGDYVIELSAKQPGDYAISLEVF